MYVFGLDLNTSTEVEFFTLSRNEFHRLGLFTEKERFPSLTVLEGRGIIKRFCAEDLRLDRRSLVLIRRCRQVLARVVPYMQAGNA